MSLQGKFAKNAWERLPLRKRILKVIADTAVEPLFADFGPAMMMGDKHIIDDGSVPTACTDGYDERYGQEWCTTLSEKQFRYLMLHETGHKLDRVMTVWLTLFKKDAKLANMAADYVVNSWITTRDPDCNFTEPPPGVLYDPKYHGWSTLQIFNDLKKNGAPQPKDGEGEGEGEGAPGQGGPGQGFDEHDWKSAAKESEQEQSRRATECERAAQQGAMAKDRIEGQSNKGDGYGGQTFGVEYRDSLVPWTEQLRELCLNIVRGFDDYTWTRPNPKWLNLLDMYMPSMCSNSLDSIVLGSDTSGSVSQEERNQHISEVAYIVEELRPESVDVLYWGSSIERHEHYDAATIDTFRDTTQPTGYGGTSPKCVVNWLKDNDVKPQVIIMLTDGDLFGDWGGQESDYPAPVIWVVTNPANARNTAPFGTTIHI